MNSEKEEEKEVQAPLLENQEKTEEPPKNAQDSEPSVSPEVEQMEIVQDAEEESIEYQAETVLIGTPLFFGSESFIF